MAELFIAKDVVGNGTALLSSDSKDGEKLLGHVDGASDGLEA